MDTEAYLTHVKSEFSRRVAADFIICFVLFALACLLAFASVRIISHEETYVLTSPVSRGSAGDFVGSILSSQLPNAAVLPVLLFSVFTVVNKWITALICIWKGASLGTAACLIMSGSVRGISDTSAWSLAVYFLASVLFASLAALSRVYSDAICRTYAAEERRYTVSLATEYIKLFFIIAGGIFLLGSISTILI